MFKEMRRSRQILSQEETEKILQEATSGVLSFKGGDEYPYGVPLSYWYDGNKIYFHCALEGHKIECLKKDNKVAFCVIAQDDILPEKFTTCYRSVIAFGKADILTKANEEYIYAIKGLTKKYSSMMPIEKVQEEIDVYINKMLIISMEIDHMTGKEGLELVKRKEGNL